MCALYQTTNLPSTPMEIYQGCFGFSMEIYQGCFRLHDGDLPRVIKNHGIGNQLTGRSRSWKSKSNRGMGFAWFSRSLKSKSNRGMGFAHCYFFDFSSSTSTLDFNSRLQLYPLLRLQLQTSTPTLNSNPGRACPRKFLTLSPS